MLIERQGNPWHVYLKEAHRKETPTSVNFSNHRVVQQVASPKGTKEHNVLTSGREDSLGAYNKRLRENGEEAESQSDVFYCVFVHAHLFQSHQWL